jgi:hypothetical protein
MIKACVYGTTGLDEDSDCDEEEEEEKKRRSAYPPEKRAG